MPTVPKIFGYTDRFSARPGESLSFHISCENTIEYSAALVRLSHGYTGAAGPGFVETDIAQESFEGSHNGSTYRCRPGSYVEISDPTRLLADPTGLLFTAYIYPTLPRSDSRAAGIGAYHVTQNSIASTNERQTILGNWAQENSTGYALMLDEGRPSFVWGEEGAERSLTVGTEVMSHHWYRIDVEVPAGQATVRLTSTPISSFTNRYSDQATALESDEATADIFSNSTSATTPFRIGSGAVMEGDRWHADSTFNGKIGGVHVRRADVEDETVARWHFADSNRDDGLLLWDVVDRSPNALHGLCHNAPMRAVTGHEFAGVANDFRSHPDQYDAIHFHDDDITDADWPTAFTFTVPDDLPSGVYAARLRSGETEQHIPFFVGPGPRKKNMALLLPTATYLAYANDRIAFEADSAEVIVSHTPIVQQEDLDLQNHPEFGRSCYEIHNDGSGVVYGSVRKPLITLQPKYRAWFQSEGVWGLPADLCIVHWLETKGYDFDVITDEDLDREGYELLHGYQVVVTGAHPEYVTRGELDALDEFTATGGRLMYLGGNGFFATVSFDPERPHLMELRRSDGGTRPHQSPFGEMRHNTSGEMAGLWRYKGRAAQRLTGVGFAAQGFDRSTYYERLQDSRNPLAEFIFEGVGETEKIGDFGIMGGGAAGAEIDCYDPALGSPPNTLVLATSGPMSDAYLLAAEEVYETLPGLGGTEHPYVRSDLVFCPLAGGGAVFSVGSIAWTGSLSHNGYDNNVSRITDNVLSRFLKKEALDHLDE